MSRKPVHSLRHAAPSILAVALLLLAPNSGLPQEASVRQVVDVDVELENVSNLAATDLVDDTSVEIVLTDSKGRIAVFSSTTGEDLFRVSVAPESALTSAAFGDFRGKNRTDIVVATLDGRVLFYEGTSMKLLAEFRLPDVAEVMIQPSVVPVRRSSLGKADVTDMLPESSDLDLAVVCDTSGMMRALILEEDPKAASGYTTRQVWTSRIGSGASAPPSVGPVRSATKIDIVAGTREGRVYLIDPLTGQSEDSVVRESSRIVGSPLLADLRGGDNRAEIYAATDKSELLALRYNPASTAQRLTRDWQLQLPGQPDQGPMLLQPIGTREGAYLLQPATGRVIVVDVENGSRVADESTAFAERKNLVALIAKQDGLPELATGNGLGISVTRNLDAWVRSNGREPLRVDFLEFGKSLSGPIAVSRQPGTKNAQLTAMDLSGQLHTWVTDVEAADWPIPALWESSSGSFWHNAFPDYRYATLRSEKARRLEAERDEKLATVKSSQEAGNWTQALAAASWLRDYNPFNEEYRGLHRSTTIRKNLAMILLSTAGTILFVGYAGFKAGQVLSRRRAKKRGAALLAAGNLDAARTILEKLRVVLPGDPEVIGPLAQVYVALQDYSAPTLAVYEEAYGLKRDDKRLLHAYTRALLRSPATDLKASAIYEAALQTFPEPQLIEYGLGMCALAQGSDDLAGKRLRAAIRGGLNTEAVYSALCDLYLRTRNFSAKALPVYQQQYARRQDSQAFLEAYLLSCIDARRMDTEVETLCGSVLEGNRRFVPAYCHLATIYLQRNNVPQAIDEVRHALKYEPGNAEAVRLLSQAFQTQSRRDDEALQAYKAALALDPENRDLLKMVADICYERGIYDQDAMSVYRRSHELNPGDATTLRALAQTALLTNDSELSVRTIEALSSQGQMNAKLTKQLALAYVRLRIHEPRAERVLREALRIEPTNAEFTAALAKLLQAQDRTDSESLPVYEAYFAAAPTEAAVGRQLAKTYMSLNRHDQALRVLGQLQELSPGDDEIKRLIALGSLHSNKLDEAVSEYQRILSMNPNDEEAIVNLAQAYAAKRRTDTEAVRIYERAVPLRPENEMVPLALAASCVQRGDQMKAVEWYQRAYRARPGTEEVVLQMVSQVLQANPEALRVRWFLTEVLVSCNRLRDAMEQLLYIFETNPGQAKNVLSALDKILAKDPNNLSALLQKGRMLTASEGAKVARRTLEKAYQLQPANADVQKALTACYEKIVQEKEDIEVRFHLGRIYYAMSDYDQAIGCFQRTSQDYRWEAESVKSLGKCFTAKGMLDLALQEYKKLVVDEETKELLYDLAQRYEAKKDFVGAKTVYRQLFAADINYKDVRRRFEMLSGSSSDPMTFEKTNIVQALSEEATRRYELLDELGRGAMGIVYRARDRELEEIVALKILPDALSNNPEAVRRFKIEARNARKMSHPHIVRIHDIGEEMGRKYISMEFVDGSDLKRRVKGGPPLSPREVYHYAMQIADALAYAHRLGIVHRDIKPANVMLTSNNDVKITDFGIAKLMDQAGAGSAENTMAGAVIGTPLYMSPEQVMGIPVDNRADLYSLGILLYELVSGRPPFTEGDLAYQHMHRDPPPIPQCPAPLWQIISRCLAKKKEERWQGAEEIYSALRSSKDQVG